MVMPDIIDLTVLDDVSSGDLAPLQPAKRKKRRRMPAGRCARLQRSNEALKHKFKAVLHLLGAKVRRKEVSEPEAYQYHRRSDRWRKDGGAPLDRIMGEVVWISARDWNGLQFRLHGEALDELVGYDQVIGQQLRTSKSKAQKAISDPTEQLEGTWN
ncbi:hypothetical protein PG994_006950 [Apiospora phragmitis]|uniref:Transposase n=1 Tax=Apiospora phragmitis TaxID=2905665 RepID=A0ABR1VGH3_9PEZI